LKEITVKPIAFVKNTLTKIKGDCWKTTASEIELTSDFSEKSLDGIEDFSHLEIVFYFHKAKKGITEKAHPRKDKNITKVGIFAMRKPDRPNYIGVTIVKLLKKDGKKLFVLGLDALDGTPILDIKPMVKRLLPTEEITEAYWINE